MKRLLSVILLSFATCFSALAQADTPPVVLNLGKIVDAIGYPMEAKTAKVAGKVLMKVKVNEKGKVIGHEIVESPSSILTNAVVSEINGLKFRAATKGGQKTTAWVILPFLFELAKTTAFTNLQDALSSIGEVESLDLSNQNLQAIDTRICSLGSLRKLNLSSNQISTLQPAVSKLRSLEELNLSGNPITNFPKQLRKLHALKVLNLKGNQLPTSEVEKIKHYFEGIQLILD